ncbi:hypothetical protein SAMN02745181_3748 [Rubritalea squalenifaciens DSM 18772]|uniref:Uncharacterized protein n=1 Tax=Rubritalea squalenifaciens DSM 18772 TaxID=1123071 RepID=A0A1M6S890_9BACT|nr:hypothetical protein SAMN02745181_3748 [Rubritalea squalenifaciens DSM 18772]
MKGKLRVMVRMCHLAVCSFSLGLLTLVPVGNVCAQDKAVVVAEPSRPSWMDDWNEIAPVLNAELVNADLTTEDLTKTQTDTFRAKWLVDQSRGVYYSNTLSVKVDPQGRLDVKYSILWEGRPTNLTYFVKKVGGRYQVVERKVTVLIRRYKQR